MGPLGRLPWAARLGLFVVTMLVFGLTLGFEGPFWIGVVAGSWMGISEWRRSTGRAAR